MKKTPSLFQRNYDGDRLVRDEVVPGSEWVTAGEGIATRKWDGTCVMVRDGKLYKRYDVKEFKTHHQTGEKTPLNRTPPPGWESAQEPDPITGHWTGWVPVEAADPGSKWHQAAWEATGSGLVDGTYELCGPHFQGNPENLTADVFFRHGQERLTDTPRDFARIKAYLATMSIEGIVWHHPDGRMVKIKARDFGLIWPRKVEERAA